VEGLEIFEHNGPAYDRTMHYGEWRVAIANYGPLFDRQTYPRIERHLLTDEVFVLLSGKASLVIGLEREEIEMEAGKLYNVKVGTWHNVLLDRDAKVLIVENHNTGLENTEYRMVTR
jgi:mannose-6-phosphate isomerase-like protein (cupin superfamily)